MKKFCDVVAAPDQIRRHEGGTILLVEAGGCLDLGQFLAGRDIDAERQLDRRLFPRLSVPPGQAKWTQRWTALGGRRKLGQTTFFGSIGGRRHGLNFGRFCRTMPELPNHEQCIIRRCSISGNRSISVSSGQASGNDAVPDPGDQIGRQGPVTGKA